MDGFEQLRRGIEPENQDGFPNTPNGRRARIYKAMGYPDSAIQLVLAGVSTWEIPTEGVIDDTVYTCEGIDDDVLPQRDTPVSVTDPTVIEQEKIQLQKPGSVLGTLPSDPIELPNVQSEVEPEPNSAKHLLPDNRLTPLEYRIRYGRECNEPHPPSNPNPSLPSFFTDLGEIALLDGDE
jgi:hypothetical protein